MSLRINDRHFSSRELAAFIVGYMKASACTDVSVTATEENETELRKELEELLTEDIVVSNAHRLVIGNNSTLLFSGNQSSKIVIIDTTSLTKTDLSSIVKKRVYAIHWMKKGDS